MNFKWDVVFPPAVTQINIDYLYFDSSPRLSLLRHWNYCQWHNKKGEKEGGDWENKFKSNFFILNTSLLFNFIIFTELLNVMFGINIIKIQRQMRKITSEFNKKISA
jgi:hypothetical protein